ncbi:MAG: hypothetical protein GXP42_04215 [Chloroflexi bacterium]|nr:hypothetical protein [Chloroflexota bacterium]
MRRAFRSPLALLLLLSAFAWAPLLAPGYFLRAHDAAHSIFWLVEFDQGIRDGFLWPRWVPDHALGYGYPLFTFYAPLVFYIGEIFVLLGASFVLAVKLTWGLAFVLSAITMYGFARRLWGPWPGFAAGLLYLFAPYHFVIIYVRAALAEFLAFALFPWVLHAFWNLLEGVETARAPRAAKDHHVQGSPSHRHLALAGLSFGLILMTHSVTVIFFPPFLAALVFYWLLLEWRRTRVLPARKALYALAAALLGMGLAAIFLLPAIGESAFIVQQQWLPDTYNYANQFIFPHQLLALDWGFGFALPGPEDGMSQQVGLWLLILGLFATPLAWRFRPRRADAWLGFVLAALVALFFTTAASRFLWDALPFMALIQFPFRLLALSSLGMALAAAGLLAGLLPRLHRDAAIPATVLALAATIVLGSYAYARPQHTPIDQRDQSPVAVTDFEVAYPDMLGSTAFAPEGPPSDTPKKSAYLSGQPLPLAGVIAGQGKVESVRHGAGSEEVRVFASTPVTLQFYTYWYPGWRAFVNGRETTIRAEGPQGLITLDLPAGEHHVRIRFTNTPLRTVASLISIFTLILLLFLWLRGLRGWTAKRV